LNFRNDLRQAHREFLAADTTYTIAGRQAGSHDVDEGNQGRIAEACP
jgi:hypothetical protein